MRPLNTTEVAERLHMKPSTVRRMARDGQLRASYVGHRWLITEDAIEDYLEQTSNRVTRPRRRRSA